MKPSLDLRPICADHSEIIASMQHILERRASSTAPRPTGRRFDRFSWSAVARRFFSRSLDHKSPDRTQPSRRVPRCNPLKAQSCVASLLLASLFLTGCSQTRLPKLRPNVELYPAPYFEEITGVYFPGNIAGMSRQPVVDLEEKQPGLGIAISYRNSHDKLDAFVYDLQASLIPQGVDSPIIQESFDDAISDVQAAAAKGLYANLQLIEQDSIDVLGQTFLHARFRYSEKLLSKESRLFVAGVNGQILKLRLTVALPTRLDTSKALEVIAEAIQLSRRSGYGGVSFSAFQAIEAALASVNLSDGLQESEAIALAQRAIVDQGLHTRYDISKPGSPEEQADQSLRIAFSPYANGRSPSPADVLMVKVAATGDATIAAAVQPVLD